MLDELHPQLQMETPGKLIALTALSKIVNFEKRRKNIIKSMRAEALALREWALEVWYQILVHPVNKKSFLPPDIVSLVLERTDRSTLCSSALVNRVWASVARPMLWKDCRVIQKSTDLTRGFRFLHTLYELVETTVPRSLPHVECLITSLSFEVTQLNVEPFCRALSRLRPCLKTLHLFGFVPPDILDRVVDRCPETVTHLGIESWKEGDKGNDQHLPYDRNKFRPFFPQFESLALSNIPDRELYLDGAHGGLRVAMLESGIHFPETLLVHDFIRSCSPTLVALHVNLELSDDDLHQITMKCPKLRAFGGCSTTSQLTNRVIEAFLQTVGSTLEYFSLLDIDTSHLRLITKYCKSLTHLMITTKGLNLLASRQDVVEFIQSLGMQLKVIDISDYGGC